MDQKREETKLEDVRKVYRTKILVKKFGKLGKTTFGSHDLVRRMDRQGEVLFWCRKCSGYARHRMGSKLMNCCRPEQMGNKEYDTMLKRIQTPEDGRVPAKEAKNWRIEGQTKRITRKEYQRLVNKFEMEGFMAQEGLCGTLRRRKS